MLQSDEDLLLLFQRMEVWFSVSTCLLTAICNSDLQRIPCSLLTSAGTRCTHDIIYKCRQTLRHIKQNQINILTGVRTSLFSFLLVVCFAIFQSVRFCFIYVMISLRCLSSNERQKGDGSGWERRQGGSVSSRGSGNCSQDMLREKRYAINKRENTFRTARFGAQVTFYCV